MHLPQTLSSSRFCLLAQYVILRYCCSNLCKRNYLYGDLPFFKIQVNHFTAQDKPFGGKIIPKCILWGRGLVPLWVLRDSSLSLTDCCWLYNIQLKTSRGVLFLPSSDAYVRSFLYLLYTLIKLCYTKLWAIKPHVWLRIEFFSFGAKNPGVMIQQPFTGKIPWRRERLPIPVFWPGEFHGLYSESQTRLSLHSLIQEILSSYWKWET